ncbi:hypothetical protein DFH11DRAFT_971242 [Phellopilus nigrolimitatus]|nr:hypothetical protein DFH11DRAFT_971242 [Phellopilus nigrolimitatus]
MFFACSTFLSIIARASAQVLQSGPPRFENNPLITADLVIWCTFDALHVVLALLCLLSVRRLHGHRAPFIALFAALCCIVSQSSTTIAYIIVSHETDAFGLLDPDKANNLYSSSLLLKNWASSLFFLAVVLLLFDRLKYYIPSSSRRVETMTLMSLHIWAATICILGTFMAGLNIDMLNKSSPAESQTAILAQQRYETIMYIFATSLFCAALCASSLGAYVYMRAWHAGVHDDKDIGFSLYIVTPLYIFSALENVVFAIVLSPALSFNSLVEWEQQTLIDDVLFNVFHCAMATAMVIHGIRAKYWQTDPERWLSGLVPGSVGQRQYLELEDPPQGK